MQDGRFRYGIIQAHVDGSYEIRYDDGKGHDHVDPALCEVDWVQPDATLLAAAARKGGHAQSSQGVTEVLRYPWPLFITVC